MIDKPELIGRLEVALTGEGKLLATYPKSEDILKSISDKRIKQGGEPVKKSDLPPDEEGDDNPTLVFRRKGGKPALDEHVIRGMLREVIQMWMSERTVHKYGKFLRMVKVDGFWIPLKGNIEEEVRAFTATTMRGPRSVVIRGEALKDWTAKFTVNLNRNLPDTDSDSTVSLVRDMLEWAGEYIGLGAGRMKTGDEVYGAFKAEVKPVATQPISKRKAKSKPADSKA